MWKILLVEDDPNIGSSTKLALESEGYEVDMAGTLAAARKLIAENSYNTFLLDVNLPDGDGLIFCTEIRQHDPSTPILVISARDQESDVLRGLGMGANDYIRKPFGLKELIARIKNFISQREQYHVKNLALDSEKQTIKFKGKEIRLRKAEFEILQAYSQKVYVDELTGLQNRRALNEQLSGLRVPYCICMIDIDHFKKFNDTYGHQQGDCVLKLVGQLFKEEIGDTAFRYGGEEFCALFQNSHVDEVALRLDRIRQRLSEHPFAIRASEEDWKATPWRDRGKGISKHLSVQISVSIGVAGCTDSTVQPKDILVEADRALYNAKSTGRNCVVIAERPGLRSAG